MTINPKIDLWTISPAEVREMMGHYAEDSATLNALMDLEQAIICGDEAGRVDAISNLTEELVLVQGWWA